MNRNDYIELDDKDTLREYRDKFVTNEDTIYMDGNSLGPLPRSAVERLEKAVKIEWGRDLIQSWNTNSWIDLPTIIGEKIAPLVGAAPGQVICSDSISINLFKLLSAAIKINGNRTTILSQTDNFPTDLYMAEGLSSLLGENSCRLKLVESNEIETALDSDVSILMLTEVNFRTGERHDMKALTELAHEKGALVLWDLAHSAGAFPVALDACNVDFAVGCGYKYLNGGPVAPAFLYVATRHQDKFQQPLCGWMGHASPFDFRNRYEAAEGILQGLCGTPPILSMVALDAALDIFEALDLEAVKQKSIALSETFRRLVDSHELSGLSLLSPLDPECRGSQLAYRHPYAFPLCQALIKEGVIVDFRSPDIIRFGFTPLYMRYIDIFTAVQKLAMVINTEVYMDEEFQVKQKVT